MAKATSRPRPPCCFIFAYAYVSLCTLNNTAEPKEYGQQNIVCDRAFPVVQTFVSRSFFHKIFAAQTISRLTFFHLDSAVVYEKWALPALPQTNNTVLFSYEVLNDGIDYEYYGISFHNCLSIWSQGIQHDGSIRLRSSAIDRRDRNRSQTVADACFHMIAEPTILRWSAIIWKPGFSSGSIVPTDLETETGYCNFQRCTDSRISFMD